MPTTRRFRIQLGEPGFFPAIARLSAPRFELPADQQIQNEAAQAAFLPCRRTAGR